MQKHKKKILGVVVLVIVAVVFFGVRSVLDSVRTADVSKTETSAKTTDGASCNNNEVLVFSHKVNKFQDVESIAHKESLFLQLLFHLLKN